MPSERIVKYALSFLGVIVLLSFSFFRVFETFELQTLDLRFKLRPPIRVNPDIVIIDIGEDEIKALGDKWPIDRGYYAALIDCLRQLGARAIIFDIFFSEPTPNDKELIEATEKAKGLVYYPVAFRLADDRGRDYSRALEEEVSLIEGLAGAAAGVGHINAVSDIDGKIRRVPLFIECKGTRYPQLAYLAALNYLGKKSVDIPQADDGTVLVNYAGGWIKTFKKYSFVDVLISFSETVEGEKGKINLAEFYNKICFIGTTALATYDLKPIPFEPRYPMVGLHANFFNSVIENKFLIRADKIVNMLILMVLCFLIAFSIRKVRPFLGLGISVFIISLFMAACFFVFVFWGIWIDLFCPVALGFTMYLGSTFNKYLVEQRKRLLMDQELAIARKIQMDFLPSSVPQAPGMQIAASLSTAKAVGGDLYDFVERSSSGSKKVGIMIGDVSGKGTPAALFMARSIADFRNIVNLESQPAAVLSGLNLQIANNYRSGLFITMFYMVYDSLKRELVFSNGGHLPAICLRADAKIETFTTEGMPLGLMETSAYCDSMINLEAGDTVVLYTDGITEARNNDKEEFGIERLKAVISKNADVSPIRLMDSIKAELDKFVGSAPQHDDCTIIILKAVEEFTL